MLSIEVAEYYGVSKDSAICSDFVTFVNGMLGLAETNRRECWSSLCLGMINTQARVKGLQASNAELESKLAAQTVNVNEALAVSERLNATNREYKAKIEQFESQVGAKAPVVGEGPRPRLQIESAKTVLTGPRTDAASAKRSISEAVPDSDEERAPPAKRSKSEVIIELRNKITSLLAENERLDKLFAALKVEVAPSDGGKPGRLTQEEAARLRRVNSELETKIRSVTEEAFRQAREYTDFIRENNAAWEKDRLEWTKPTNGMGPSPQPSILLPSLFSLPCGSVMSCPVPIRTGRLMQLLDVYQSWLRFPADNEGMYFTTILCPYSTRLTTLASAEELLLIHSIASELRLYVVPPLRFQYFMNGNWLDFTLVDQISIAAMCCKHYRLGTTRTVENVLVCHGDYMFKIHITDNVVDFRMQPTHNMAKSSQACLMEAVPDFFQRWTYPTGDDGGDGSSVGQ